MAITDEQIKNMTQEEWDQYISGVPYAMIDFRNTDQVPQFEFKLTADCMFLAANIEDAMSKMSEHLIKNNLQLESGSIEINKIGGPNE